jgi:hypothetical protein
VLFYSHFLGILYSHPRNLYSEFVGTPYSHRPESACIFTFLQIALIGYVVYGLRGARLATLALTVFSLSYVWFAYFIGQMAWTDTWL